MLLKTALPVIISATAEAQNFGNISLQLSDDEPRVGREMTLSAQMPTLNSAWRYTFLCRFDDENRWTILQNRGASGVIRWTPPKGGNVELRVDAVAHGQNEMRHTVRTHVRTGQEPVRQTGRSSLGIGDFPAYQGRVGIHVDRPNGLPGESRRVTLRLTEARNGRRITFMVRHESDQAWRTVRENSDTLVFNWTPERIGRYELRADVGQGSADERAQMSFQCLDPNAPAGARMRGR